MKISTQKSSIVNRQTVRRSWFIVDASDKILGRLSTRLATVLMGKHKPDYSPQADCGDFVIVVNAEKIRLTGNKAEQKVYQRFSGYPGGRREIPYKVYSATHAEEVIRLAVRRMLPKSFLGEKMIHKLKVYRGAEHEHQAQRPKTLTV